MLLSPLKIPVIADYVLSPIVVYGPDFTSICFETEEEQFGRIVVQSLDALKVCRGQIPPYETSLDSVELGAEIWVYRVEDSQWLKERYAYEKQNYGDAYEWGNSVEEMLTDYSHYFFRFHDEFIEVIAKGFWYEQSTTSLLNESLPIGHPFLPIDTDRIDSFELLGQRFEIRQNSLGIEELEKQLVCCQISFMEVWNVTTDLPYLEGTLKVKKNGKQLISFYQEPFGKAVTLKTAWMELEEFKEYLKNK